MKRENLAEQELRSQNHTITQQPDNPNGLSRRSFVKAVGLGSAISAGLRPIETSEAAENERPSAPGILRAARLRDERWPVLKYYDQDHLSAIALPLGGIGTGTVSLGGRGDLRDWEIMNRPAKGFIPNSGGVSPFFALFTKIGDRPPACRILEGPLDFFHYEGSHGSRAPSHNFPRFRHASFAAAYPMGAVQLSDPGVPVEVDLKAFNPLIPGDPDSSSIPIAVLTFDLHNLTDSEVKASICASLPNCVGIDGSESGKDWKGDGSPVGAKSNRNEFRSGQRVRGLFLSSEGVDRGAEAWGTLALATTATDGVSSRTSWERARWGSALLDFWDDFSADGRVENRQTQGIDMPIGSLAVEASLPPGGTRQLTFVIAWHFPNRYTWTPKSSPPSDDDRIGNYYTTQYSDAWDVVEKTVPKLPELQERTTGFLNVFLASDLPAEVKESALFNISTLRTQTCFRTADGRFYGFEGSSDHKGCCHGSCTHVWNYEQATAFLFGSLALSMREVEFGHATDETGLMNFRVNLPLGRSQQFGKAAADGQMGCILKMYRDWQLSGNDALLQALWPKVRKAVEFCWIEGGWDADRDGVMEGCQHNTMDVEYYGPNPQMGIWYLGALRAAEEMARHLGESGFAETCRRLFEKGRTWIDANLFNGEYYVHEVRPPSDKSEIAPRLLVGMGAADPTHPNYQLASGCLVDQLVGQFTAHVCGLGYLVDSDHVRQTLKSILKHNGKASLEAHFNCMRSFALDDEAALLMASYPSDRPKDPFPYFTEVMTGFEYTAAVGMLYEGMQEEGLRCIRNIRRRYDGRKRSPFDEAECGHHYARAMTSWAAILALSGFRYSGVTKSMKFAPKEGTYFWSNGYAWGNCTLKTRPNRADVRLTVQEGDLALASFELEEFGQREFDGVQFLRGRKELEFWIMRA